MRHSKHFSNQILSRRRNDVNFNYTLVVTNCLLIFLNKNFIITIIWAKREFPFEK